MTQACQQDLHQCEIAALFAAMLTPLCPALGHTLRIKCLPTSTTSFRSRSMRCARVTQLSTQTSRLCIPAIASLEAPLAMAFAAAMSGLLLWLQPQLRCFLICYVHPKPGPKPCIPNPAMWRVPVQVYHIWTQTLTSCDRPAADQKLHRVCQMLVHGRCCLETRAHRTRSCSAEASTAIASALCSLS